MRRLTSVVAVGLMISIEAFEREDAVEGVEVGVIFDLLLVLLQNALDGSLVCILLRRLRHTVTRALRRAAHRVPSSRSRSPLKASPRNQLAHYHAAVRGMLRRATPDQSGD